MAKRMLGAGEVLLVASRGDEARHGLWLWREGAAGWEGRQVDTVAELSALCGHPYLPVVYGTAGIGEVGTLHAWHIGAAGERLLSARDSGGAVPCHLTVDPSGRLLIATNYTSSTLALQLLAADGSFDGPLSLVTLGGSGPEVERQEAAHPHQAFFVGERLVVIDLGADLVREFEVDPGRPGAEALREVRVTPMPAGSGPRHGVELPDGLLAVSGELGEDLLVGRLGEGGWADIRSTRLTGPGRARWDRNYPGDIQRSIDGRHVYFANRSHNTIATFDVTGAVPELVAETDATVDWPQHMAVLPDTVLVAGWDSSRVVALPLVDGIPQRVEPLFDCAGAGWLHVHRPA